MNLMEAYEAMKQGKIIKSHDCSGQIFYLAMPFFPTLPIKLIIKIYSAYRQRITTFDELLWEECSDLNIPVSYVDKSFPQVTCDEMLKEIQDQWDKANIKTTNGVMVTS